MHSWTPVVILAFALGVLVGVAAATLDTSAPVLTVDVQAGGRR
jgi:hypothetical protein